MLNFTVVTLFPDFITQGCQFGVLGQALHKGRLSVSVVNPREFTTDVHHTVDDRPFGGGDGMVMLCNPLVKALQSLPHQQTEVYYLSPQGEPWTTAKAREFATKSTNLVLISGRYGGVDQRFLNRYVQGEISVGDYVLSGGEIAALAIIDSTARFVPGVLGHENSAESDSFSNGTNGILECPQFTRPREFEGVGVPEILLGGHHGRIQEWKTKVGQLVTLQKRPELVKMLNEGDFLVLKNFWLSLSEEDKNALGLRLNESSFRR